MALSWTRGGLLASLWASCALLAGGARDFNYVVGTQAIYGRTWQMYNFTDNDALTENANGIVAMGANQLKLRMAKAGCQGYRMTNCAGVTSLKDLSQVPAYANAFAQPAFKWYQIWLYTFANAQTQIGLWTPEASEREYTEVKEWAVHMLETYSGTGKVFMAGNWEGDWMLMYASGNCRLPSGRWNMSCELRQEAIDNMIEWGRTRQRAIDDARAEAQATDVSIFYYIEFNLGPPGVAGRPGVTNSVIPHVNPDLVSFSSYSSTNDFNTYSSEVPAVDERFDAVMDNVQNQLSPKDVPSLEALGFQKRVFVGEYGASRNLPMSMATRVISRVCHAVMKWGAPFALYWEFYDNYSNTAAIIPPTGEKTPIWHLFNHYYRRAEAYVTSYSSSHSGSPPSAPEFSAWGQRFFEPRQAGTCEIRQNTTFAGEGFETPATTAEECWRHCDENPSCAAGVFGSNSVCHVKYSTELAVADSAVACVRAEPEEEVVQTVWV